ncbi:DMT family transporter [Bradyrhizobium japonicum]|nr:DMT family transporter [Bradyrhizobium japonicum]
MGQPRSERGLGIALVISAAIAWSTAPFFTRLLPFDPWTILFWRGLFAGSLISVFLVVMQGRAGLWQLVVPGKGGLLVASLSAVGMVSFIPALQMTKVMNVAVLIATQPFVAAALAWLWLGEAAT